MILARQYGCDTPGCTAVRTETNHWHVISRDANGIQIRTWAQAEEYGCLNWPRTTHHCGHEHALRQVSILLGEKI